MNAYLIIGKALAQFIVTIARALFICIFKNPGSTGKGLVGGIAIFMALFGFNLDPALVAKLSAVAFMVFGALKIDNLPTLPAEMANVKGELKVMRGDCPVVSLSPAPTVVAPAPSSDTLTVQAPATIAVPAT